MVDPMQLQFLQAVQQSGPLTVTVHHSQQGDIIENLVIVCESRNQGYKTGSRRGYDESHSQGYR